MLKLMYMLVEDTSLSKLIRVLTEIMNIEDINVN